MPMYVYICNKCGVQFERRHPHTDTSEKICFECGGILRKKILPPTIHFKGSGFYSSHAGNGKGDKE